MQTAVVIPSKNVNNLIPCLNKVFENEPEAEVYVINDGLDLDPLMKWMNAPDLPLRKPVNIVRGTKPFVFARNVNMGIQLALSAHPDLAGVVVLNDDATLESALGFTTMAHTAQQHQLIGLVGATTNITGARCQHPIGAAIPRQVTHIAFVCVYIPRRTIETLAKIDQHGEAGLLDERFVTYGWEDNDYQHRCRLAGLFILVEERCFVDHSQLVSTWRGVGTDNCKPGDIEPGRQIFREKWGPVDPNGRGVVPR